MRPAASFAEYGRVPLRKGRSAPGRERGAALIVLMTLLVLLAISLLLDRLNQATALARVERDLVTARALQEAKTALIAYSVFNDDRPGSLPCPDAYLNPSTTTAGSDGFVDLFSGNVCPSPRGRFPWRTLGIAPPRDASGEVIWYAIHIPPGGPTIPPTPMAHLDHPAWEPVNSETPGMLSMAGGAGDLVAVLLAPGPPIPGASPDQNQRDTRPFDQLQFLEGENADGGDVYVAGDQFDNEGRVVVNDRVLTISRAELMAAVERRVLAETAGLLREYRDTQGGAYPWLIPFDPQGSTPFVPTVGTTAGHLPVVDPDPSPGGGAQPVLLDGFTLAWDSLADGTLIGPFGTVNLADIETGNVTFGALAGDTTNNCRLAPPASAPALVRCTATEDVPQGGGVTRRFQVDFWFHEIQVLAPNATQTRRLGLSMSGELPDPPPTSSVTVFDWVSHPGDIVGSATFAVGFTATGNVAVVDEVDYAGMLDGDEPNLPGTVTAPEWFTNNGWDRLVYVAYAPGAEPGGGGCTPGTDCLSLTTQRGASALQRDDVEAVVLSAGAALAGQDRVTVPGDPSDLQDDYFEAPNVDGFEDMEDGNPLGASLDRRGSALPAFNDQARAVSCVGAPADCF